jgi:hypothetical protein
MPDKKVFCYSKITYTFKMSFFLLFCKLFEMIKNEGNILSIDDISYANLKHRTCVHKTRFEYSQKCYAMRILLE